MAEQEQDKLLIRLHVYDTDLSVRIPREDEEYYRKSAKLIDDIVNSYTKIFKGRKSDKEILYMALIDVAGENSWGAWPLEKYRLHYGDKNFTFVLIPLDK